MWDSNPLSAYDIALLVRGFFMENSMKKGYKKRTQAFVVRTLWYIL